MLIFLLVLVLLAALLGILGAIIKVTLILVFSFVLALAVIGTTAWLVLRNRMRKFSKDMQDARASGRMGTSTIEVRGVVRDDRDDPKALTE